jgi:DNA-binding GntR family transcriptional regulator
MIFHRLAGDGVLKHLPRRGFQLRPFHQKDLDSYIQMREVIELKALDLAWPWLVDADILAMLEKNRLPEKPGDEPQSDNSLHAYLVEKSQNAYIADFFERHGRYYKVLFDWEGLENKEMIETVRQHRAILEALLRRDRPAAERALVDHIRNNHPVLMRIIQENSQRRSKLANGKPFTGEAK